MSRTRTIEMTFALNATESDPIDLRKHLRASEAVIGIEVPSGFTGTTLMFKNRVEDSTFKTMVRPTDGTDYTVYCAASQYAPIPPQDTKGFGEIKGVASAQASAVTLRLVVATVA